MAGQRKIIVVEGKADRLCLQQVLAQSIPIICTFGTISEYNLDELLEPYEGDLVYVFVDADYTGERIRTLFRRNYPEAIHLYTDELYKEVEATPYEQLVKQLSPHFDIKAQYLNRKDDEDGEMDT